MSEITDKWRKLRQEIGNLICDVDGKTEKLEAEEKRMENKRDESYLKGTEDMRKAVNMLYDADAIGLTPQKMENLFGTNYIPSILSRFPAITVINILKCFLKEKEQEFKVGDEVECIDAYYANYKEKYVIAEVFEYNDQKAIRLINLRNITLHETTCVEGYRKTGKHYDAIPIPKEDEEEEGGREGE